MIASRATRLLTPLTLMLGGLFASGAAIGLDRVTIPTGPFMMGCSADDRECDRDEGPQGGTRVDVPAFAIDRNEVTVAEYRACVEAGRCTAPKKTHADNQYCNYDAERRDRHPVNCVDWGQALNYCKVVGGRLPMEAEWEKAARAGSMTPYPWGREVSCKQAILDELSPQASDREPDGCFTDASWPVGSRPANAFGLFDMHGNVGEWTDTWYAPDAITAFYAKGNLKGPDSSPRKVVRGGSWDENRPNLRSSFRNVKPPQQGDAIYGSIGFRCAYDVQ